jgi:methylmalonyl-CoA/ethylmalonyl-CoA epimerase
LEDAMKGAVLFAAGIVVGAVLVRSGVAQTSPVRGLNHVGIVVADYDAALEFYTKTLGFPEAYTIRNPDGSVRLTYLQLSRSTVVELIPAGAGQPTGITHFGIEVDDIDATVAELRRRGTAAADASLTPANAEFTRIQDRDGVQIEVMELGPQSLQRKAIDAWK